MLLAKVQYKADPVVTPTGGAPPLTFYPDLGWTCGKWQNMVKSTYLHGADLAQSKKWKGKILFIFYVVFRENRRVVKSPRFWSPLVTLQIPEADHQPFQSNRKTKNSLGKPHMKPAV